MRSLAIVLICIVASVCSANAREFIHPGALSSRAELDFVKAKIQAGVQPWKGEFDRASVSPYSTRQPHPLVSINSKSKDASVSRDDAIAAYTDALLWYFSGDETYAKKAVAILNAWSSLQAFTSHTEQDRLQAGWIGAVFAPTAEIMRLYPNWTPGEIGAFQKMFKRAFYPQLQKASPWNGNVDLTEIDALMGIAVFCDDDTEFNLGLARLKERNPAYFYLRADGPRPNPIAGDFHDLNRFWFYPRRWVDGLTQESGRDNGHHAQFALGSALHSAEIAWHQGVDVYSQNQDRYVAAMELMATQFLSGSMQQLFPNDTPTNDRYDTWEIGYNHYHNRCGLALPKTGELIVQQIRSRADRTNWNLNYETLTHADLPKEVSPHGVNEMAK